MKKTAILLSLALLSTSVTAFAGEYKTIDQTTINGQHAGIRQADVKDITITETAPGLFEKDSVLYFQVDHLIFEEGAMAEVTKGDLKIKKIETEDSILKITIEKASSEPSELKISNIQFYLDGSVADGTYDLELITEESDRFPNNAVGGFYEQSTARGNDAVESIPFIKDFLTVSTTPREQLETPLYLNTDSIVAEKQAYLTEDGIVMLPLRAIVEGISDKAIVRWDDATKTVTIGLGKRIGSMTVGSRFMNLNGVATPMEASIEVQDGRVFIPLQDLAYLLGIHESKIQWNPDTMTVTFQ